MKQISLNISDIQEESIQKIINLGFFPNRSLAIRYFIQEGINETIKMVEKLRNGILDYNQSYSEKFYKLVHARITGRTWLPKLLNIKGDSEPRIIKIKLWCTKCDCLFEVGSIAMDCPNDGLFMTCPKCMHRIVIFVEGNSELKKYISILGLEVMLNNQL